MKKINVCVILSLMLALLFSLPVYAKENIKIKNNIYTIEADELTKAKFMEKFARIRAKSKNFDDYIAKLNDIKGAETVVKKTTKIKLEKTPDGLKPALIVDEIEKNGQVQYYANGKEINNSEVTVMGGDQVDLILHGSVSRFLEFGAEYVIMDYDYEWTNTEEWALKADDDAWAISWDPNDVGYYAQGYSSDLDYKKSDTGSRGFRVDDSVQSAWVQISTVPRDYKTFWECQGEINSVYAHSYGVNVFGIKDFNLGYGFAGINIDTQYAWEKPMSPVPFH